MTDERRLISAGPWTSPAARAAAAKSHAPLRGVRGDLVRGSQGQRSALAERTRDSYRALLDGHILPTFGELPSRRSRRRWSTAGTSYAPWAARPPRRARTRCCAPSSAPRRPEPHHHRQPGEGAGGARRAREEGPPRQPESSRPSSTAMPEKHRLMVMLASWCALRFGELAELRRGDLDPRPARPRPPRGGADSVDDDEGRPGRSTQ